MPHTTRARPPHQAAPSTTCAPGRGRLDAAHDPRSPATSPRECPAPDAPGRGRLDAAHDPRPPKTIPPLFYIMWLAGLGCGHPHPRHDNNTLCKHRYRRVVLGGHNGHVGAGHSRGDVAGGHNGRMWSRVRPGVAGGQNGLTWPGSPLHQPSTAHQRSPNAPKTHIIRRFLICFVYSCVI